MHPTAMINAKSFFDCYSKFVTSTAPVKVVEIGSQDVNGSLRGYCPENFQYIGVDFVVGKGVDIVLVDPYTLPFETGTVDIVISSSCLEHSEMFWVVFLEIMRVLKPNGLFYMNVPSNGDFHRYPVDCWRFYPDSGRALVTWAKRNGINVALLESYTSKQVDDIWNDFVAVFIKDESHASQYPDRILDTKKDFTNGLTLNRDDFLNFCVTPEGEKRKSKISQLATVLFSRN